MHHFCVELKKKLNLLRVNLEQLCFRTQKNKSLDESNMTTPDISTLKVLLKGEGEEVAKTYTHPRTTLTVLAAMAGMSVDEINQMLSMSDDDLQAIANRIGQEMIVDGYVEASVLRQCLTE